MSARVFTNHRYRLHRSWIGTGGIVNFIGVNPSKATCRCQACIKAGIGIGVGGVTVDDATVRKCTGYAQRWGFSGFVLTNLWGFRATDPKELQAVALKDVQLANGDLFGHDEVLRRESKMVVPAWGSLGQIMGRDQDVLAMLADFDLYCIGKTQDGFPLHPCRPAYTLCPVLFRKKVCVDCGGSGRVVLEGALSEMVADCACQSK